MVNFSQKQIVIVGAAAAVVAIVGVLVFFNLQPSKNAPIQLTVWGFDKADAFSATLANYKQLRPNISVSYKQVSADDYQNYLLNALASGQGPDVFPVHNRALGKIISVLYPAPAAQLSVSQVQNLFPSEVEQDFGAGIGTANEQIFALPLSFDTLAVVYNKSLLDQGGVAEPPATWGEFQSDVVKLRAISPSGQITRAGAAIGSSRKTITNAVDLLNVLMLQNGVTMLSGNRAAFSSETGLGAFNFYLQFANPSSNYYTWNDSQQGDFDSFAHGDTAIAFAYNSDIAKIKTKSPFLKFGVAPLPQADLLKAVNYADYWGFAVSKQTRNATWAWDFVVYAATQPQAAGQYSAFTGNPPALRQLISAKINDPVLGVFAKQALTARSWYQVDEEKTENIFDNAISAVLNSRADARKTLEQAQGQVSQLMAQ